MGASNKICPSCGRKMKQQFIGLQHCKCGMSWKKDIGFFERTGDMVFALEWQTVGKKNETGSGDPARQGAAITAAPSLCGEFGRFYALK